MSFRMFDENYYAYGRSIPPAPPRFSPLTSPLSSPLINYSSDSSVEEIRPASRANKRARISYCYSKEIACQTEGELHVNTFMHRLKEQLLSGQYSDIVLNAKGKEFSVHRSVLAAHSPVFQAMMTHNTKEKATGVIMMEDNDPDTISDLLHFMYSGSVQNINSDNVVDLYTVADKYQVSDLCYACVVYMMNHIMVETFCGIMALSVRYNEKKLFEMATKYFLKNAVEIMKRSEWLLFLKDYTSTGNELVLRAFQLRDE